MVNPDEGLRAEGIRGLSALVRCGRALDAPTVYVRPGGLNPRGHWYAHPENHLPETFDAFNRQHAPGVRCCRCRGHGAGDRRTCALDAGHSTQGAGFARCGRFPALKFNIDPVNFYGSVGDVHDTRPVLNELFDLLGKDTVAAHFKDLALEDELVLHIAEVVIGQGQLDYGLFLRRMQAECPDTYGLIEHLPEEKIPSARAGLMAAADKAGIVFEV